MKASEHFRQWGALGTAVGAAVASYYSYDHAENVDKASYEALRQQVNANAESIEGTREDVKELKDTFVKVLASMAGVKYSGPEEVAEEVAEVAEKIEAPKVKVPRPAPELPEYETMKQKAEKGMPAMPAPPPEEEE